MKNQPLNEASNIENLKRTINGLIEEYKQTYTLLNDQIQAVINQDIELLNGLIEKQVAAYESLKESENKLKQELQSHHSDATDDQKQSLGLVLENLSQPSQTLNALRDKLHAQVEETEKMQSQLMDLLQFAQQHNAEIFKAICEVGREYTQAYDGEGQKQQRQVNGLAVNQKA